MKRGLLLLLTAILASSSLASCAKSGSDTSESTNADTAAADVTVTETETTDNELHDNLGELNFEGKEFRIRTIENVNVHNAIDAAEQTGVIYDDSLYERNRKLEERFNTVIVETIANDTSGADERKFALAGEDAYEAADIRCPNALVLWEEGLIHNIEELPNIDLTQPYWSSTLNSSITLGNQQYVAIGAFDMNVYDLVYCLLFNKSMITDFNLDNPYELVNSGKWTMDSFSNLTQVVAADIDGDGEMTIDDRYGYLGHPKQVLPGFWIGAGVKSIEKNSDDLPYNNMTSEKFNSVFNKVFEITYDTGVYYDGKYDNLDVPTENRTIFADGRSLFMDVSLFWIASLRDMETDFGVLPYPKYDEAQDEYYTRVSYYWAVIVPITNTDLSFTGAMLEALNCESHNIVIPAYYEITLKTKYSRDAESEAMLDLIFNRVTVDIGDTTMCDKIRDGFMASLFDSNKRDLSSKLASVDKLLEDYISKIPVKE